MKRIQLTVASLLAEDKKFYHNMLKRRLRKSRRAGRAIERTLTKLILEEADYTAPNPLDNATPEIGLDERLVELFNTQVYERMKSDAAIDLHPERGIGRDFGVEITLDRDANPDLYECYEAFFKLVSYTAEQDRKIAEIGRRIGETGSEIERTRNSLPRLKTERDRIQTEIYEKKGRRKTEAKIEGLNRELDEKKAAIMQSGRTEKELILKQKELNSEKEQAENERNCSQRYFLSGIAGSAASAGLAELEDAARKMAGDGNKAGVSRDLITYLDENFTEAVTQNVICGIDFPKNRPFIWPQWARITGAVAAAGVAALVGGIYLLSGGTRSSSQQIMDDYQRFRRGELTVADLDERYPPGTEELGILLKTMIKDGYLKTGSKINLNGNQFELVSEIGNPRPEEIIGTSRKHEGAFRVGDPRRMPEEIVEEEEWTGRGMERDGSRWKPVLPPGAKRALAGRGAERHRDVDTGMMYTAIPRVVPPDFKGKWFYELNEGEEIDIDLGTEVYTYNAKKGQQKIWITHSESDSRGPSVIELMVDEEKRKISPIWPAPRREGTHIVAIMSEDTEGLIRIEEYRMDISVRGGRTAVTSRRLGTKWARADPDAGILIVKAPEERDGKPEAHFDGSEQFTIGLGNYFYTTPREKNQTPLIMRAKYNTVPPRKEMMPLEIVVDQKKKTLTPIPPAETGFYMLRIEIEDYAGNKSPTQGFLMRVRNVNGELWYGVKPGDPKIQRRMNARRAMPPDQDK